LGGVRVPDQPYLRRHYPGYLGHSDYVSMVEKCLEASDSIRFDTFDAISNNEYKWRSTRHATEVLGWEPRQSADGFGVDDEGSWQQVRAFHGQK